MRDVAWICGIWADGALLQLYDPRFNLRRSTSSTISRVRRPRSTLVAVLSVGCGDRVGDLAVWERYGWFMAMSKVGRSRWLSWFISHIVSIVNHSYWSLLKQLSYRLRAPHCSLSFQHSLHHIHNIYQHVRLVDLGTSVFFALDRMHRHRIMLDFTWRYTYSFVSHATVLRWCPIVLHHLPLLFVMPVQTPPREEALQDSKRIQQENDALAKQWTMRAVANSKICYKLHKWD